MGRVGWREVKSLLDDETELVARFSEAEDTESAYERWLDETEDDIEGPLLGLDLGTNALVAALKASRCLPYYSCNGGAFGGHHNDSHPVVAFFCRSSILDLIVKAAEMANAGLEHNWSGGLSIYGESVGALLATASAVYSRRKPITAVRLRQAKIIHQSDNGQSALFDSIHARGPE